MVIVIQNRRYAGRTIPRQASQGVQALEAHVFLLDVISTLHLSVHYSGSVSLSGILNIRTSANINIFVLGLRPATVLVDPILLKV